ncbi:MAG: extracellular solute-binding protein, partial [Treponema sp.]|nr:extracellular solute-binding protein [Treponema sp.]
MKRIVNLSVFHAALILVLLGACSQKEDAVKNEKVTLSVYCSKDAWRDIYSAVAQKIGEDHGIEIDLVTLPNEQIEPVISVKLATNDPPDLFLSNTPQTVEQYNATQTCLSLDDQPWVPRLAAPDLLRYKGDGKIYGMPSRDSSSFFGGAYYNKA